MNNTTLPKEMINGDLKSEAMAVPRAPSMTENTSQPFFTPRNMKEINPPEMNQMVNFQLTVELQRLNDTMKNIS